MQIILSGKTSGPTIGHPTLTLAYEKELELGSRKAITIDRYCYLLTVITKHERQCCAMRILVWKPRHLPVASTRVQGCPKKSADEYDQIHVPPTRERSDVCFKQCLTRKKLQCVNMFPTNPRVGFV